MSESLEKQQIAQMLAQLEQQSVVLLDLQEKRKNSGNRMVMGWVGTIASVCVVCIMMLNAFKSSIVSISNVREENLILKIKEMQNDKSMEQARIDAAQDLKIQSNAQAIERLEYDWNRPSP